MNTNVLNKAKEQIWTERYRPKNMSQLVLPANLKQELQRLDQHFLLVGPPGTGKTSTAKVLAKPYDTLQINASRQRGIDVVRHDISKFAQHMSLTGGGRKIVILDEIDNLHDAAQKALRGVIEEYASVVRFIATCNYPQNLDPTLIDRFRYISFEFSEADYQRQVQETALHIVKIVEENGMRMAEPKRCIAELLKKYYPSIRHMVIALQSIWSQGIEIITVEHIRGQNSTKDWSEAYQLLINTSDPRKLYTYFSAFRGQEQGIVLVLQTGLVNWLIEQEYSWSKIGKCWPIMHRFGEEFKRSSDPFVSLLAMVYELSLALS